MTLNSLALKLENQSLHVLDQQLLPFKEEWIEVKNCDHMIDVIRALKVRGAPLIGVAAVLSLALEALRRPKASLDDFLQLARKMREARPTAVNLMNAVDRVTAVAITTPSDFGGAVFREAVRQFHEDVDLCEKMSACAADLISDGDGVLTHCNSGGLATAGRGTALGAITYAWDQKKSIHVYVDETRPLLQGGRLTAWELAQKKIPHTLICDNMAGYLMSQKKIQKVFVGTDRVALNGDFANKVGTYSVAVLCRHHAIPFYVVGPSTTVDRDCKNGSQIPIEERSSFEVRGVEGSFGRVQWASEDSSVYNPAFDVTPVDLVTGIVIDDTLFTQKQLKDGRLKDVYGR